jgi:C1A family cysteine protease
MGLFKRLFGKPTFKKYGWKPDVPDPRDFKFHLRVTSFVETPSKVDLRPEMPPVWNQGELGSCTAQAAGAAFQYVQMKLKQDAWTPSRLMIYYMEREMENTINEDAGAMIRDGVKVLTKYGVAPEALWPYNISKFTKKPPASVYKVASYHQVLSYARVDQTANAMEQVLAKGYPIIFGFAVFESFETPDVARTGMMVMPKKKDKDLGGHAVLIVGYDREKQHFIVRNSWSEKWGDKGHFYMPYEYALDPNLADDFWVIYNVEDEDGKTPLNETSA